MVADVLVTSDVMSLKGDLWSFVSISVSGKPGNLLPLLSDMKSCIRCHIVLLTAT